MYGIALKMLLGDRGKYTGIVIGIALSSFVMLFQPGLVSKFISEYYRRITDINLPDIWVMDSKVKFVGDSKPIKDTQLYRVRGIKNVQWAIPLHEGRQIVRTAEGELVPCALLGIDEATLIGAPAVMAEGKSIDLRKFEGIIIDESAAKGRLARPPLTPDGPSIPIKVGDALEINDKRAVIVGLAKGTPLTEDAILVYTTYSRVKTFETRSERKFLNYILVKGKPGVPLEEITGRITRETGLAAYTAEEFKSMTIKYMVNNPVVAIFVFMAIIAFMIGAMVTGQIFYNFTLDNLRYFSVFKAMGTTDGILRGMIFLQAFFVGITGYGIGAGVIALYAYFTQGLELAMLLNWELLAACALAVLFICIGAALISIRKVMKLEPATVFNS